MNTLFKAFRDAGVSYHGTPVLSEENIAVRIEWEMRRRGWSQERLAKEMADAGYPLHQSAISKIVNPRPDGKRRAITVDEAIGFSKVFDVPIDELPLPLEVAQSQEIHLVIEQIEEAQRQRKTIFDQEHLAWMRLMDLIKDKSVFDGYVQWLCSARKIRPKEAVIMVLQWSDRAISRSRFIESLVFEPHSDRSGMESLTVGLLGVSVAPIVRVYKFVKSICRLDRAEIEGWLSSHTPDLIRSGFAEMLVPLINKRMDGRLIESDEVINIVSAINSRLQDIADMEALTDDDEIEKLAAMLSVRYIGGENERSLSFGTGKPHDRTFSALERAGLLP